MQECMHKCSVWILDCVQCAGRVCRRVRAGCEWLDGHSGEGLLRRDMLL